MNRTTTTYEKIWEPSVWLPSGVDWDDLKDIEWPIATDILYSIPVAIVLIIIRYFLERYTLYPWARYILGRKNNNESVKNVTRLNPHQELILEEAYQLHETKLTHNRNLSALAKKLDLEIREIERWIRIRNKSKSSELKVKKLVESGWRFLSYTFIVITELYVLWDKTWLWDINKSWTDFPYQNVTKDVWWFWMLMTGFYSSHLITLLYDVKRKDFWAMGFHHLAQICSSVLSWNSNLIRISMLVCLVHDTSDVFLEGGKLLECSGRKKHWVKWSFVLFLVVWVITRIIIYPFYMVKNFLIDSPDNLQTMTTYKILTTTALLFLCLNVYWTYLIFRAAFKAVSTGKLKDGRSSDEDED